MDLRNRERRILDSLADPADIVDCLGIGFLVDIAGCPVNTVEFLEGIADCLAVERSADCFAEAAVERMAGFLVESDSAQLIPAIAVDSVERQAGFATGIEVDCLEVRLVIEFESAHA